MSAIKDKNYYQILGVSKTASTEQIRRRYRQLARKYHPDLNHGDKKVEQLFKEVNEAQEVLCDPEKRAKYDRFGRYWQQRSGMKSSSGARANVDFERYGGFSSVAKERERSNAGYRRGNSEVFGNFASAFGGGFSSGSASPSYTEATITLTFSQAFHGSQQHLEVDGETIKVRIPPGARPGSRISMRGRRVNPHSRRRGDLDLKIRLQSHPVFKLQDNNIVCEICITPIEAVLGAEIEVPTVDGSAIVKVPPGVNSGQSLRLKNKGWRSSNGKRGDQIVTLKIVTPKKLTIEEREYYEKLRQNNSFYPRRAP